MKESIFFNREQLQIIRWYGLLYQAFFEYWVWIFSFLFSLLWVWGIIASWYFSSSLLVEGVSVKNYEVEKFYELKEQNLRLFPDIEEKILNGKLSVMSGTLLSQANLLSFSGIALPNLSQITTQDVSFLQQFIGNQSITASELSQFFSSFLVKPLSVHSFGRGNPSFIPLTGSLKDTFWLTCLQGFSRFSPICRSYVRSFLENFYSYDLWELHDHENENQDMDFEESFEFTSPIRQELWEIFQFIKSNRTDRDAFCKGLLRYGLYGWTLDDTFTEIFHSCSSETYSQFILLRDFAEISRSLALGYSDARVYSNLLLNQYKLFSLQQLIYKQLMVSADVKSLIQSYLGFLRENLMREANKKITLLWKFSKLFTYWYNMNIISPYLKDEKSKMEKEDRTALMGQLLAINYGDRNSSFVGLQDQIWTLKDEGKLQQNLTQEDKVQDLEKLFRSSYLPPQFTLISLQKGTEDQTLLVKGVDRKTDLTLELVLKYEQLQLLVVNINVVDNQKLTDYLQALLVHEKVSLTKILSLISENKEIAEQTQALDMSICTELKSKYKTNLLACSDRQVKIQLGNEEKTENWTGKSALVYTFMLNKGKITRVQVSDKVLETKLLKELDLSLWDATTSLHIINSVLGYTPQEKDSWFWMKDQVLVTDKFVKYLGITPDKVISNGGDVSVYFTLWGIKFIGVYDIVSSEIKPLSLDFWTVRRPVIVQKFSLLLREDQVDTLNRFVLNPLSVLRQHNKALVQKYFPEGK